jgi:AcrR family transcriptional regulator
VTGASHADAGTGRGRAQLTREAIVDAALALADDGGLGAVTMRRLGSRLGVDPMTIYRHFRSKDDVLEAIVDRALGGVAEPAPTGEDWLTRLREVVRRFRAALLAHPAVAPLAASRVWFGENSLAGIESMLAVLRGAGLGDAEAVRAYQALVCYTIGFVTIEAPMAALPSEQAAERARAAGLAYESLPASRFPNTVAMAGQLSRIGASDEFEPGLDLLLQGLARQREARRS